SLPSATRETNGCGSTPIEVCPRAWAASSVVPDPAKGSRTLASCTPLRSDSTHCAENPAEYRNHLWMGNCMLFVKFVVFVGSGAPSELRLGWNVMRCFLLGGSDKSLRL